MAGSYHYRPEGWSDSESDGKHQDLHRHLEHIPCHPGSLRKTDGEHVGADRPSRSSTVYGGNEKEEKIQDLLKKANLFYTTLLSLYYTQLSLGPQESSLCS